MIQSYKNGMRCRAIRMIRSQTAMISRANEGTIANELENLGRTLILVRWDTGLSTYVFPDEIEVMGWQRETEPDLAS